MAETAVTSNLGWDNFFSTTTTGALTATTTTIPLATPPTPTEGFLVLDPGGANEIIFYNSVSGNNVIVPSTDDRGRGDSTAQSHSSGITVKMNTVGMMFEALQSGLALTASAITTAKIANAAVTVAKRAGGFYIGQISAATFSSTGNKSVTGVGFTPKFVMFFVMPSAATSASTNAYGAMTTTVQFNTWASSNSAGNTSARNNSTTACVGWGTSSASSYNMSASYVSMDADGFTINVGTADGTFAVQYIAFG